MSLANINHPINEKQLQAIALKTDGGVENIITLDGSTTEQIVSYAPTDSIFKVSYLKFTVHTTPPGMIPTGFMTSASPLTNGLQLRIKGPRKTFNLGMAMKRTADLYGFKSRGNSMRFAKNTAPWDAEQFIMELPWLAYDAMHFHTVDGYRKEALELSITDNLTALLQGLYLTAYGYHTK